ncbi:phosphopantetheine adenylyltransferase [Thermoproteota archaeon]
MNSKYKTIAFGGTFDYIHKGHKVLFTKAFDSAENILIGVTTDVFALQLGKKVEHNYKSRVEHLRDYLDKIFDEKDFQIVPLEKYFGFEIYADTVEAIVASTETSPRVIEYNKKRIKMGFKPLQLIMIDIVLADDKKPISSSRIRLGEINEEGQIRK